jgi:long-chain acyl-CoA synthetase
VNIKEMLERAASEVPQKTAIILGSQRVSYRELDENSNRVANALIKLGIKKGDHVAILMSCTPEWVINYFGVVKAGAMAVPFDIRIKAPELESKLLDSDSKILITEERFSSTLSSVLPNIPVLEQVMEIDTDSYSGMVAGSSPISPSVDIKDDDETIIVYTSGVLGKQKGIVHTHAALMSALLELVPGLELKRDDVVLGMVPFYYLLGLTMVVLMPFIQGSTMVILSNFSSRNVLETVEREKVTMLVGVPASYNALARVDEETVRSYDLSSLRVAFSAGAKSSARFMEMLENKFGLSVCEVYGLTECLAVTFGAIHDHKLGTAGKPLCELKVLDYDGKEVPRGMIGEAVVRAPWVVKGYYKAPDLTAQVLKDGWFHTGDLVRVDEDGYLEYIGKESSIIVTSGGVKISPMEVEDVLLGHPAVAEAAYVGVIDEYKGQIPTAFIVLKEGQSVTAEEIRKFCSQSLADFKLPKQIRFMDSIPKTESGQIDRRRLSGTRES